MTLGPKDLGCPPNAPERMPNMPSIANLARTKWFPALRNALPLMLLLVSAGTAQGQQMAVTFDDLPAHGDLPPGVTRLEIANIILATLKQERMPAAYGFINGKRIEEDASSSSVLDAWRAAGQPLGNHTFTHGDLNKETPAEFAADVQKNEPLLKRLMGKDDWHWFRYPFLHEGESLAKRHAARQWLTRHGYRIAEVDMDFEDYLWNAPYARCMAKHDEASIRETSLIVTLPWPMSTTVFSERCRGSSTGGGCAIRAAAARRGVRCTHAAGTSGAVSKQRCPFHWPARGDR